MVQVPQIPLARTFAPTITPPRQEQRGGLAELGQQAMNTIGEFELRKKDMRDKQEFGEGIAAFQNGMTDLSLEAKNLDPQERVAFIEKSAGKLIEDTLGSHSPDVSKRLAASLPQIAASARSNVASEAFQQEKLDDRVAWQTELGDSYANRIAGSRNIEEREGVVDEMRGVLIGHGAFSEAQALAEAERIENKGVKIRANRESFNNPTQFLRDFAAGAYADLDPQTAEIERQQAVQREDLLERRAEAGAAAEITRRNHADLEIANDMVFEQNASRSDVANAMIARGASAAVMQSIAPLFDAQNRLFSADPLEGTPAGKVIDTLLPLHMIGSLVPGSQDITGLGGRAYTADDNIRVIDQRAAASDLMQARLEAEPGLREDPDAQRRAASEAVQQALGNLYRAPALDPAQATPQQIGDARNSILNDFAVGVLSEGRMEAELDRLADFQRNREEAVKEGIGQALFSEAVDPLGGDLDEALPAVPLDIPIHELRQLALDTRLPAETQSQLRDSIAAMVRAESERFLEEWRAFGDGLEVVDPDAHVAANEAERRESQRRSVERAKQRAREVLR